MDCKELFKLISKADEKGIKAYCANKKISDCLDKTGNTPLFFALSEDNIKIAKLLVELGENIHLADKKTGNTPLHIAARKDLGLVEMLIEKGVNVNAQNKEGWTPLHAVFYLDRPNLKIAEALIIAGANVNLKTNKFLGYPHGKTVLHLAAMKMSKMALKQMEVIIDKADVNNKDIEGSTALFIAATEGKADVVEYLLNHGADPNIPDSTGYMAVELTTSKKVKEILLKWKKQ